jgi:hypothetical protein
MRGKIVVLRGNIFYDIPNLMDSLGSKPLVGSSKINISGSFNRAEAIATLHSKERCWIYCLFFLIQTYKFFSNFSITDILDFCKPISGFPVPSYKGSWPFQYAPTKHHGFLFFRQTNCIPEVLLTTFKTIPGLLTFRLFGPRIP